MMKSRGEQIMCKFLDILLPMYRTIDNYRPTWLTNPKTGFPLEIDRYYPDLKVGFEFQGEQHIREVPNMGDFSYRKELDKLKWILCKSVGVMIIQVEPIDLIHDRMVGKVKKAIRSLDGSQRTSIKKQWRSSMYLQYRIDHEGKAYRDGLKEKYPNIAGVHRKHTAIRKKKLSSSM